MIKLLNKIQRCEVCKEHLPLGPRPVIQLNAYSKIVIISQAPGRRVHETGIPWNDASGKKLKSWMNVSDEIFYNPACLSILPMGFCYPGKAISGDLPPRPECAPLWHPQILKNFKSKPLILLIGQYAQRYYLKNSFKESLTETVRNYKKYLPTYFPLPHPSPRNQNWVKINPWFMEEVVPELQKRIQLAVSG
ncbi:uracil-DNA glycosylase family protein [Ginsengibacter hankyongi]|uniref:Uracil-DNA glycosylase family protein n=1 Tax=Ginsengibacter hankyongi TaxID=2607284 RepID=A0A5J5IID2_9BACT|nr:uracil-DNA glycosylase family protein [Ginsengibacter hankyongi]KAA9040531.1 uracil-DNA glycosylase family protein [Ginsengibacter hankyongi]